ncbi:hypothetical protein F5Y07DRAFT_315597 [Xylaria sp. FL0933]|nr:hypothetical protein F5Y07DRAFT_315597 [Xylaria sp. FL0933]
MPPSSSSQCYQAVRRHLRPHYDGIWVPDSLLASAFERYAATFRTGARYGSSVPGPMEHRKRLAKRHMGELHFGQSHSAAPIWQLASLVDLTQWKWTAPTPPEARCRTDAKDMDMIMTTSLRDTALNLLRSLSSPRTDVADDSYKPDKLLLPQDTVLRGVAEAPTSMSLDVGDSTHLDVFYAALDSLSRDKSKSVDSLPLFSQFCDSWQHALMEGIFQGEAIVKVVTDISEGLSVERVDGYDSKTIDTLRLYFLEATIEGVSKWEAGAKTSLDPIVWSSILHEMSTIQMNTIRVFTKAIACIPEKSLEAFSQGILANLDNCLKALGRASKRPTLFRQTAKMAVPLKSLGAPELRFLLDNVTKKVLEYRSVESLNYLNIRFSWLLLLARLPGVDQQYLAQTCVALEASPYTQPLGDSEICQLFLVSANSLAPLHQYQSLCQNPENYRLLGTSLWRSGQFYRARAFSRFLYAIGRETQIGVVAKGALARGACRTEPSKLVYVALKMRRPRSAIDILCLYEQSRRQKFSFWGSRFGFKALEILTWSPELKHRKLWKALSILPDRKNFGYGRWRSQRERRGQDKASVMKITAVGIVTGLSPHVTTRQALSLTMTCYHNLQARNIRLPRSFLRALVHNVTRQLVDGEPGITSRLRYIVYIVRQQMGRQQAYRLAMAMQQRRNFNMGLE